MGVRAPLCRTGACRGPQQLIHSPLLLYRRPHGWHKTGPGCVSSLVLVKTAGSGGCDGDLMIYVSNRLVYVCTSALVHTCMHPCMVRVGGNLDIQLHRDGPPREGPQKVADWICGSCTEDQARHVSGPQTQQQEGKGSGDQSHLIFLEPLTLSWSRDCILSLHGHCRPPQLLPMVLQLDEPGV